MAARAQLEQMRRALPAGGPGVFPGRPGDPGGQDGPGARRPASTSEACPRGLWVRRRGPDPLGEGVWRRAHDRFRRAVDRYHGVLEHVPEGALRAGLESTGAQLAAALDLVHTVCVRAQAVASERG